MKYNKKTDTVSDFINRARAYSGAGASDVRVLLYVPYQSIDDICDRELVVDAE